MNQWKIRLESFGWGLLSLVGTVLGGLLISPEFRSLISDNFGVTTATIVCTIVIPEVLKFFRNRHVAGKLGATNNINLI